MKRFYFNKLIRDNILENMLSNNDQNPKYKVLEDSEYLIELKKKLFEETKELDNELAPENLEEEIADVLEILDHIIKLKNLSKESIESIKKKKLEKIGGFSKKYYVEYNEVEDDSEWAIYYRKQPDKYHESN